MAEFIEFEAEDVSSIENDELDETLIADPMMIDDAKKLKIMSLLFIDSLTKL